MAKAGTIRVLPKCFQLRKNSLFSVEAAEGEYETRSNRVCVSHHVEEAVAQQQIMNRHVRRQGSKNGEYPGGTRGLSPGITETSLPILHTTSTTFFQLSS